MNPFKISAEAGGGDTSKLQASSNEIPSATHRPRFSAGWKVEAGFFTGAWRLVLGVFLGSLLAASKVQGALATCWHIPDNTGDLGFNMRNPETAIGPNTAVKFYTGVWKWNGAQLCNQTGGTLYFKTAAQSAWSTTNFSFYSNVTAGGGTNNQYWQMALPGGTFSAGDTVQYFFLLTFDGFGGVSNTWLYGNNAGSTATASSNTAAASPFTFTVTNSTLGTPVLTVNGVNADYTASHVYVNELNSDAVPLTLLFTPNGGSVTNVEIFSNLNRRDRATQDANGDGIEDGIVPPDGNFILAGDDSNYYKAYAMTNLGGGNYSLTLQATKTGAYRLTARFKVLGSTNWNWYSGGGRRDHALVVTPSKARDISMYELNALTIGAQGTGQNDRSTFTDLYNGPGARGYDAVTNRFNLQYAQNLGINWLWFQPIHPPGILNRQIDPATSQPYQPGSPYAVKNFFQINPLLSKAGTRDAALAEFTNFVAAADAAGISIMLDEPFNHTAWDAELDASGVYYFKTNAQPTDLIANSEARFYSRSGTYDQRASSAANVAQAPDRYDFGKWSDVADVYFGRYAALVPNSSATGNYTDESDWFDYTVGSENSSGGGHGHFDATTQNVWRYFADSVLYWLDKTGCPPGTPANLTYHGVDGVRADFGQGLPPQGWEYIINKVRARKWDFVFMTESLDGGAVTYRSNRHFDILNENLIFSLQSASTASDYRSALEARRAAYGQALVLLNHVSHDEQSYSDPYQALIRHAVVSTVDGAPMIFYGEELGISTTFGFDLYELNFGKNVPHFKKFNSLQPVFAPGNRNFGLDQLWPVYAGINQARHFSRALRSSNRYFIDQVGGGGPQPQIYSVAKYEQANGAPNFYDVVFGFANLDRNNNQQGNFNVNITQNGANLFGIKSNRVYNVKNIAAYTAIDPTRRNHFLVPGGVTGTNLLNNGLFVWLKRVPATDGGWSTDPFEAQYLKLYDVTPPPAPSAPVVVGTTNNYLFTNALTFAWSGVTDAEGGIAGYHVWIGTTPGASNVFNGLITGTTLPLTNSFGAHLYATVAAVNPAGIESAAAAGAGILLLNPAWVPVLTMTSPSLLNWTSISGLTYQVWSTTNLQSAFTPWSGPMTADSPVFTVTNSPTNAARFFKVQLVP
jgi:glycosidase